MPKMKDWASKPGENYLCPDPVEEVAPLRKPSEQLIFEIRQEYTREFNHLYGRLALMAKAINWQQRALMTEDEAERAGYIRRAVSALADLGRMQNGGD